MKSDDTAIPNILQIKTISPSSSKDLVINTASESRASSSTDSSDNSPSDLRKRLEDLPSPNEFIFLADRVAAHGRRICRKREGFLRLHGVANRIEENDEWEEREQRAGLESFLEASRPKDARARRRARARLESSPCRDDKTMVISQAGGSTGPFKIIGNDKLNPAEFSADDRLRLPAITIPRGQSRSSSLSEPSSTRFSHHSNGEPRDIRCKTVCHSYRNFTPRDRASKSADLPSVSPFSLSGVQPKKFGGYRPPSGVILKNLSSGSESESANEASRGLSSARKIGNTIATLELSSPESVAVSSVNGPIKKMPIMSARTDITGSILPNLLPSSRSLDNDDLNHRIAQNTSRSYIGQVNRDGTKTCNELGKVNTLVKDIFNERASHDGFVAKTSSELRQAEPEYEDTRYQQQETPQATSTFFARSFMSGSAKLVTSTYNEQVIHNEPAMKAYNEFKHVESEFENERGEVDDYQRITSKIYHHDMQDQFEFNCPTSRSNFEVNSLENNGDVLDVAEWNRSTGLYTKDAVDTSHFMETIQNDVAEALSSQTSEPYGSEDHSRSSCTAKMYLQKETLSSRRPQNSIDTSDKCDQEFITKVPTLALNSQDISYSTSAGSRECSATRPLDPHALIKALSDVSLKQEKQGEDVSRKREGFYRGKDTIDVSSRASDFPTKGETWRVPRFSTSESPGKSLSCVPSRIPVRFSSSRIIPPDSKLSGCYRPENSSDPANYAESTFIEQNDGPCVTNSSYSQICERDSSLRSLRNKNIEVAIAEGAFAPDDETTEFEINDRAPGSLTSSNLRSSQGTPFGDYSHVKMQHLSESKFQGESCTPVFFRKAAHPSSRDYARIDDDVRSRSDRSTSRKSVDTMDVTSATESPGLSKYKKTESSQIESLRNVRENITWRTEDECASINDEENPEEDTKDKDYMSRDKMPEELYLQESEHYKPRMYDSSPLRTQQFESSSEIQKGGRKRRAADDLEFNDDKISFDQNLEITKIAQSEDLTFQVRRTQELSSFAARISSSMLNLNCEPKRKKKRSQERFPFTISEASGTLSAKHEDASDHQSPDENLGRAKMDDQLREKTVYQLKTHPSVTRLATSGMEDTVADILSCVAQEKKEDARSSKSKLKALVRIFSSKLRKAPKQPSDKTAEPAKIIYENNACRAESKANSCSGDSSTEEARKTCSNNRWIDHHAARSKPMLVSSWETLKKTESLQAIAQDHLPRRYDRDDQWVQDIKDSSIEKKDSETQQRKDEANRAEESPAKDRYSIFLAKNLQSNRDSSPKELHNVPISDHAMPPDGKGKRSIDRKVPSNFISEVEEIEEELTDCLCWRLCHIIAPFKYRSSIKEQASKTKRSNSLLLKRKK